MAPSFSHDWAVVVRYRLSMAELFVHTFGPQDGEPILAIHGVQSHGQRFAELAAKALPADRVIAPDLRGHGMSTYETPYDMDRHVADLLETMDAHGLDTVRVVGHSFGANITTRLIEAAPERVLRAILLDPAIDLPVSFTTSMVEAALADQGADSLEELVLVRRKTVADHAAAHVDADTRFSAIELPNGRWSRRYATGAIVVAWSEMSRPPAVIDEPVPVLLVIAEKAGLVLDRQVTQLRDQFGELLTIERIDCGHMLYWEALDETAALVDRFFH
jgi:lipase